MLLFILLIFGHKAGNYHRNIGAKVKELYFEVIVVFTVSLMIFIIINLGS